MTGLPDTERRRRRATLANPSRAAILWEEGSRKYSLWTRPEGGEGAVWEGLGKPGSRAERCCLGLGAGPGDGVEICTEGLQDGGGAEGGAEPCRELRGGVSAEWRPASPTSRPGAGPEGGAEAGRRPRTADVQGS